MTSKPKRAIGVDLSYVATGIAWNDPRNGNAVTDTFATHPDDGVNTERAAIIAGHVHAHASEADLVVIEDGVNRSHAAFASGILHGIVRHTLSHIAGRIVLIPPATLKKYATGKGNADKTAVVVAARERLGYDGLDNNEADALWLRAIGYHLLARPVAAMPQTHVAALHKLEVIL